MTSEEREERERAKIETNKNKFIEDWSSARENLEHNFRWSRRNLALVGLFGIALPIFVYKGIVREFSFCVNSSNNNKCGPINFKSQWWHHIHSKHLWLVWFNFKITAFFVILGHCFPIVLAMMNLKFISKITA